MDLSIHALKAAYTSGSLSPADVIAHILETIEQADNPAVWITPPDKEALSTWSSPSQDLPLYGIPFVVKDNIDVAGLPTTAACPDYSYIAEHSAAVVQNLIDAGAIFIGKTNLDQFATGLVGVRTPYGVARNPFNADSIPGGSSSGSAVAVASDFCTFSLGTDTAGSGRIPASFNNLVGLKPSKGLLSTRGVVPACRSLDCVSIFAKTCADAQAVFQVAAQFDENDPFSRPLKATAPFHKAVRLGVPKETDLTFFGDAETEALFEKSIARFKELGAEIIEIDFQPFMQAARLLYEGPWVTERYVAIEKFLKEKPKSFHPITRAIISGGEAASAADLFKAEYRLAELRRETEQVWADIDAVLTPTAGTHYTVAEVEADPILLNSNLGTYTNFMNLLDFSAIAVPAGFVSSGMPWGVTLFAPAFRDEQLLQLASEFHQTGEPVAAITDSIQIAVCGAHLAGFPLNHQLTDRGATLVEATQTAPSYRFYAMPSIPEAGIPPRPALIYDESGSSIDVEVWQLTAQAFGEFTKNIPTPLGIGKVTLKSGHQVPGFIAEPRATEGAEEITELGSWKTYSAR